MSVRRHRPEPDAPTHTVWAERTAVSTIWFALAETINGLYQSNSGLLITLNAGYQSVHAVMCKG
jgi:hypothetical protein